MYSSKLKYHFKPRRGWMNDPNGLVYFNGQYHIFYQHAPDFEQPWKQPMHWGHAVTNDFISWQELPIAIYPDREYDKIGCWSGTAAVKDGQLWLIYASVRDGQNGDQLQGVSAVRSKDGIHFEKVDANPLIGHYPPDGGPDFRDPALCLADDGYYCVMASGNPESHEARLLLYKSDDLISWQYKGIMCSWENSEFAECPSFISAGEGKYLLAASVCPYDKPRYFSLMYGKFENGKFTAQNTFQPDRGPDQYAGQVFRDHKGRNLLITWIPGWGYEEASVHNIGCLSVPRELTYKDGKVFAYPPREVQHLLKDSDPCVMRTENGFVIHRSGRESLVHEGEVRALAILRDEYVAEVFVNGGECVYSVLL
ncbi:MAG: glycoside hydrolase family 32 protein [Oscillospiraceae bacterium]|nr:glycoside hydrolase family 32 protein [Oscillospiraceae bacterium]